MAEHDRNGELGLAGKKEEGIEVLVPGQEQGVGPDRHQGGRDQGDIDVPEDLGHGGAVHPRAFVELERARFRHTGA